LPSEAKSVPQGGINFALWQGEEENTQRNGQGFQSKKFFLPQFL